MHNWPNYRERNQFNDHLGLEVGMQLTADGYKKTLGNIGNVVKLSSSDDCPIVYFY